MMCCRFCDIVEVAFVLSMLYITINEVDDFIDDTHDE